VTLILPRLPQTPPEHFELQTAWQRLVEAIEANDAAQQVTIDNLAAQLLLIQAAQTTANTAIINAATAQTTANTASANATAAARETARINSYPSPSNNLSAADVGTDCTITIANHDRIYPVQGSIDVPDLAITGGTVAGLTFSTLYYVYYDDTTLADDTPAFLATTTAATAGVGAAAGRHFVGSVTTPTDGGGVQTGGGYRSPGGIEP
jgi:hypothetical protein